MDIMCCIFWESPDCAQRELDLASSGQKSWNLLNTVKQKSQIEAISKLSSVEFEAKATGAVSLTERKIHIGISYTAVY